MYCSPQPLVHLPGTPGDTSPANTGGIPRPLLTGITVRARSNRPSYSRLWWEQAGNGKDRQGWKGICLKVRNMDKHWLEMDRTMETRTEKHRPEIASRTLGRWILDGFGAGFQLACHHFLAFYHHFSGFNSGWILQRLFDDPPHVVNLQKYVKLFAKTWNSQDANFIKHVEICL